MSNGHKPKIDRQREHQANERTFLAWLRTSIALVGFGFAIARFGLFLQELHSAVTGTDVPSHSWVSSQVIGVGLVIVGIVLIALAAWNYNRVLWQIERGNYQPNPLLVWITAAIVMILGTLSLPLVLWRQPSSPNSPSPSRSGRISRQPDLRLTLKSKHPRKFS
jgi:putative membrane protein